MILIGLICLFAILIIALLILLIIYFDKDNITSNNVIVGGNNNFKNTEFSSCRVSIPRYIKINSLVHNDFNVIAINDKRIVIHPKLRPMFWRTESGMQCFEIIQPELDELELNPKENNSNCIIEKQNRNKKINGAVSNPKHNTPIIIDILKYNDRDVRNTKFDERMILLKKICIDIKIDFPKYKKFKHYEHFGKQFKKIIKSNTKCIYFKSNDKPYFHPASSYKWIDKNLLRIVVVSNNVKNHYGFDFDTDEFPIDKLIDSLPEKIKKSKNKQKFIISMDLNTSKIKIKKVSKSFSISSNYKENINTWIEINKGITLDGLLGNTIDYLKKMHRNAAEKYLYKHIDNNKFLLDIGSGRGNYFRMWKQKHLNVYAIEPDSISYKQLEKKKKFYDFKSLNTRGQNYDGIMKLLDGEKMDYITFIYSLTFFFKDDETLDNLIKLIYDSLAKGGIFLGQVMDGNRLINSSTNKSIYSEIVDSSDNEHNRTKNNKSKDPDKKIVKTVRKIGLFDCKPYNIKLYLKRSFHLLNKSNNLLDTGISGKVFINIDDPISLVHDQWEYIVDFEKFTKKLDKIGIKLQSTGFLDREADLLNRCPEWFTRLSRWFIFKKT